MAFPPCFITMFPYRAPYTQSADMALNCNFWKGILSFYPGSLFFSLCNHQKCSMQNSSGMSAVSNNTNQNIYQDKQKKKKIQQQKTKQNNPVSQYIILWYLFHL